jgi:hypothetical protein
VFSGHPILSTKKGCGSVLQVSRYLVAPTSNHKTSKRRSRLKGQHGREKNRVPLTAMQQFPFPFQPYPIQIQFMTELYKGIDESKICIFESPTGTVVLCCVASKPSGEVFEHHLRSHEVAQRSRDRTGKANHSTCYTNKEAIR